MRLLLIGDVIGRPGRTAVKAQVPSLRDELELDVVVANGENVAGGAGIQTILSNGNIQGAKTVLSGITPGKVTDKDVQYAATCTTDGTPLDTDTDFVIRVTFTTTE